MPILAKTPKTFGDETADRFQIIGFYFDDLESGQMKAKFRLRYANAAKTFYGPGSVLVETHIASVAHWIGSDAEVRGPLFATLSEALLGVIGEVTKEKGLSE